MFLFDLYLLELKHQVNSFCSQVPVYVAPEFKFVAEVFEEEAIPMFVCVNTTILINFHIVSVSSSVS